MWNVRNGLPNWSPILHYLLLLLVSKTLWGGESLGDKKDNGFKQHSLWETKILTIKSAKVKLNRFTIHKTFSKIENFLKSESTNQRVEKNCWNSLGKTWKDSENRVCDLIYISCKTTGYWGFRVRKTTRPQVDRIQNW